MRILICTHEYPPRASGIGNVVKYITDDFIKRGNQCIICSPIGPDISLGSRKLIEKFGGFGILYFWYRIQRYFNSKTTHYDVVWLHNPLFLGVCPLSKAVVTMHSTYYGFHAILYKKIPGFCLRKIYYKIMTRIERFSLRKLVANGKIIFTTVGQTTKNELYHYGIKKVRYIPNGVNTKRFRAIPKKDVARSSLSIAKEATVFLALGRLTHEKMPLKTIDVISSLKARRKHMLLVVGTGELLEATKNYAKQKGVKEVKFLGFVPHEKLPSIIACADYYLTTTGYESGQPPLAMLEAMACGLPPIVPDLLNHVIAEAKCGLAFNSTRDISYYLDTINYEEQSQLARKYALEHDWSVISNKYANIFEVNGCE